MPEQKDSSESRVETVLASLEVACEQGKELLDETTKLSGQLFQEAKKIPALLVIGTNMLAGILVNINENILSPSADIYERLVAASWSPLSKNPVIESQQRIFEESSEIHYGESDFSAHIPNLVAAYQEEKKKDMEEKQKKAKRPFNKFSDFS